MTDTPELRLELASGYMADVTAASSSELQELGYAVTVEAINKVSETHTAVAAVDAINSGCGWGEWLGDVIDGVLKACVEAKVSLVGGEMASMRDIMRGNSIDLIVSVVGVAK